MYDNINYVQDARSMRTWRKTVRTTWGAVSSGFLHQSDEEVAKEGVEPEDWSDDKTKGYIKAPGFMNGAVYRIYDAPDGTFPLQGYNHWKGEDSHGFTRSLPGINLPRRICR